MAQSNFVPVCLTDEKGSAVNAPVWTVPSPTAPNPDMTASIPQDSKQPPSFNEYPTPSAPDIGDLPPNYFDISIVPNGSILHYNEVVPYTEPSQAKIERKNEGVTSFDPLIDDNPDQLWLYFMTYLNEKPTAAVSIHGYHVEHYTTYEQHRTADGNYHTRAVHHTRNVTDFNFTLDLVHYVTQQWWRVAVLPCKQTPQACDFVTFRDALEQYTRSTKQIKEITCQKQLVGWNFQELRQKIKALIYATGYHAHVNVSFVVNNHQVKARSPSRLSRFSNSLIVRILCVLTCLWIIFGPIYLCLRSAGQTRDRIVADYAMTAPIDTFLQWNSGFIANSAISRSCGLYTARFG